MLDTGKIKEVQSYSDVKRATYFFNEVIKSKQIWLLTDEHGCVMLTAEGEDCVAVWPNQEFAELWATDEWQGCTAESVSLNKWVSRWTQGLEDDQIAVAVFPNEQGQGLVFYPDEFEQEISKRK